MSKATKPPAHHIAAVQDAVYNILIPSGRPHYVPDIVRETGLPASRVRAVLDYWDRQAQANPKGRDRIAVTRMAGQTVDGGFATNDRDVDIATDQRDKSIDSQSVVQASRRRVVYLRKPADEEKATKWARAERRIGPAAFATARAEIDQVHMDAMRDLVKSGKLDFSEAWTRHYDLMTEIDAL